ncbi:MAG TPA: ATP-binding SpoIIE family protein phosphatase [Candidatus Cybelea sp.]|jgi:anti-sigma regulatory factor (Ser/Thr protein kinase)|nr:ATP-binding SpoIIE family protein phosphatase [Candidatus Cybelea sp.]
MKRVRTVRPVQVASDHSDLERRLVRALQQATLPNRLATVDGASLSAVYSPAASEVQVGGDWYDAFDLDDHRVLITVGDVTGHGLQASIIMGKLRHAINVIGTYESDPARILDAAERILLRRYPNSIATCFCAILNTLDSTIEYANAGHPYPLLRRSDGSLEELKADGLPIGLRSAGATGNTMRKRLDGMQLLAFYTDGLIEAKRNIFAGEKLLRRALRTDAIFYVDNAAEFIERYCLRRPSTDDVAILVLDFVQSRRWRFDSKDWQAARVVRHEFVSYIESSAAPGSDVKAAELIFGELTANVAKHAAGPLEIGLGWQARQPVLHFIDRGKGYAADDPCAADLLMEHGRGLWLVQRLGAQLDVEILPGYGTHVQAALPIRTD